VEVIFTGSDPGSEITATLSKRPNETNDEAILELQVEVAYILYAQMNGAYKSFLVTSIHGHNS